MRESGRREPASEAEIGLLEGSLGVVLPSDYRSFLASSNGYSGRQVILFSASDVLKYHQDEIAQELNPRDMLLIGNNGGLEGYVYDLRSKPWVIQRVPLESLEWSDALFVSKSFEAFIVSHIRPD